MDWREIQDDSEKYRAYLCSREWSEKRNAVKSRCSGVCERCRMAPVECVHHLTYARKYEENLDDLLGCCRRCHEFVHGMSDDDPKATRRSDWDRFYQAFHNDFFLRDTLTADDIDCFFGSIRSIYESMSTNPDFRRAVCIELGLLGNEDCQTTRLTFLFGMWIRLANCQLPNNFLEARGVLRDMVSGDNVPEIQCAIF